MTQIKTLEAYIEIRSVLESATIVHTAISSGMIDCLQNGQKTASEIAEAKRLDEKAVSLLCETLIHIGILEKYEPYFALSPAAQLLPSNFLESDHWEHLGHYLESGKSLPVRDDVDHDDLRFERDQAQDQWMRTPSAMDAATVLDFGKARRGLRVLELGCCSGIFSATLAHRDPDSTFVLVDRSENLELAKTTVESIGIADQFEFVTSESLLPETEVGGFDLILSAGQMHRQSLSTCKDWFKKIRKLCHHDGEIVMVDLFPGQEKGARNLAYYSLQLGLRTTNGELHSLQAIKGIIEEAGFKEIQFAHLPSQPFVWGLLVASC